MKKFLTILVVLTAVCGAVNANEIDNPKASVGMAVMKTGSIVKLFYKGSVAGDVKVAIYNAKGDRVFRETIRNIENFVRPYNFSSLEEGEYVIELDGADGKQLQKVSYFKGRIERLMNLVHLAGPENKYVLTVSNKGNEKLQVRIYDAESTLLYSETESFQGDFAKIYNLNKVGEKFRFEVTDSNGLTKSLTYSLK
jgi:hypothetical protein